MELWIHDLSPDAFNRLVLPAPDREVLADDGTLRPCTGCFGCWIRTPGTCVLSDGWQDLGARLARTDRVVVVSRCLWGSYSPFVRNVIDRSIGFNLPFFQLVGGETHHKPRYPRPLELTVHFYGADVTEAERRTARALVMANGRNFHCPAPRVTFHDSPADLARSFP
jgi:hypothetical protein